MRIASRIARYACTLVLASSVAAATRTWTGGGVATGGTGTERNWTDAANWGGAAPVAGDDLVFPGIALGTRNDFPADTAFRSMSVTGVLYVTGNAFRTDNLTITSARPLLASMNMRGLSVRAATTTIHGGLVMSGGELTGPVILSNSYIELYDNPHVGSLSLSNGSNLNMAEFSDSMRAEATADSVSFDSSSIFVVTIRPGNMTRLTVNGDVTLAGARLLYQVTDPFAPLPSEIRIIDNLGAKPVSGTFDGLPDGASLTSGNRRFTISYHGGTGNDVVLTPFPMGTSTVVATTAPNPSVPAQQITFTATVTTSGETPTGDVHFRGSDIHSDLGASFSICSAPVDSTGIVTCSASLSASPGETVRVFATWPGTNTTLGNQSPVVTQAIVAAVPALDFRTLASLAAALAVIAAVTLTRRV